MQQIESLYDERLNDGQVFCTYCAQELSGSETNQDHVPTKALLDKPYPPELPTVTVHAKCNNNFSADELYFAMLLGCVLSGSADASEQTDPRMTRRLQANPRIGRGIAANQQISLFQGPDDTGVWWRVDTERVVPVVVKNARGHVLYEESCAVFGEPLSVRFAAFLTMSEDERKEFEDVHAGTAAPLIPEIGTRAMVRSLTNVDLIDGWVVVQEGIYRYAVVNTGDEVRVRAVIREYLATEARWSTAMG